MSEAAVIATKLFMYAAMMGALGEPEVGVGAYYMPGVMEEVCVRRVQENWTPGLQCDWPCLVAGIEQDSLGEWWLVDVPGASMHLCQVVDVGCVAHLPALRARGEVVEIPHWLAMKAGWDGYEPNVRVWRIQ